MFRPLSRPEIASGTFPTLFLWFNAVLALVYFSWWFALDKVSNPWLYGALFIGEVYHVLMVLFFWFTIRHLGKKPELALPKWSRKKPTVDVFLTVAGEPIEIVRTTLECILHTNYKQKNIYILNDSFVAGKDNWKEYEVLAKELGVNCLTRREPGGAKAGNINSALRQTSGDLVAIFDADMCPERDFFAKTVPYFVDEKLGFVQTPQYYSNQEENLITSSSWEQQEFFFGPIMRGKNDSNAAFICGTNVVIRRTTLEEVGGMNETSIAEDFLTSLFIHEKGWNSIYVPEVLAQGLAPEDLYSYYKQQLRWARGSLEVLFTHNPLFSRRLSWAQKLEYLSSALYYCGGAIVLIDALVPIVFLWFGLTPIETATTVFALYFLPFMITIVLCLHMISGKSLTLRAISFTQASWFIQLQALLSAITGRKMAFAVTSKTAVDGNFLSLAIPHLVYIAIAVIGISLALYREGLTPALVTNTSWVLLNIFLFVPFILSAIPRSWSQKLHHHFPILSTLEGVSPATEGRS